MKKSNNFNENAVEFISLIHGLDSCFCNVFNTHYVLIAKLLFLLILIFCTTLFAHKILQNIQIIIKKKFFMTMSYFMLVARYSIISDNVIKWRHDFSKHKNVSKDRRITSLFVLLFALLRRRSFSCKLVISKKSINLC